MRIAKTLALVAAVALGGCATRPVEGTLYRAPGPPPPVRAEAVVVAPGPGYVWIPGHWNVAVGGAYVWESGRWELVPRGRRAWVPGRWRHDRYGYYWVAGHWRSACESGGRRGGTSAAPPVPWLRLTVSMSSSITTAPSILLSIVL